jgi:hypothetical protein
MRKILILSCCVSLLFSACSKDDNDPKNSGAVDNSMKYIINGITDVTVEQTGELNIPLEIKYESGNQEKISLAVNELPENMGADFTSPNGIPSFATFMRLYTSYPKAGTYPVKITGTTESGKQKSWNMSVKVNPLPYDIDTACVAAITGEYNGTDCEGKSYKVNILRGEYSTGNYDLVIKPFPFADNMWGVRARLSCRSGMFFISGRSGNTMYETSTPISIADPKNIVINFQYYHTGTGTSANNCKLTLKR